jgi:hypothetical protein
MLGRRISPWDCSTIAIVVEVLDGSTTDAKPNLLIRNSHHCRL